MFEGAATFLTAFGGRVAESAAGRCLSAGRRTDAGKAAGDTPPQPAAGNYCRGGCGSPRGERVGGFFKSLEKFKLLNYSRLRIQEIDWHLHC